MINWQQLWQQKGVINYLLLPLAWLFYLLTTLRKLYIKHTPSKNYKAHCPIIIIGNINVGGAGKTPFTLALGDFLKSQNIPYAVISKGYGGDYQKPTIVTPTSEASLVGDEPILIKTHCDCPVVVAKERRQSIELVNRKFPNIKLILSDDGLQDYRTQRDLEICIINQQTQLGNRWLLPAGGLRETPSRLKSVDLVVYNGKPKNNTSSIYYQANNQGWLPATQKTRNKYEKRILSYDSFSKAKINQLTPKPIKAIAAIAHPHLFFNDLIKHNIHCETQSFVDHHRYQVTDLDSDKTLLMTEKDQVKIKSFNHSDAWYLKRDIVLSDALKDQLMQKINPLLAHSS